MTDRRIASSLMIAGSTLAVSAGSVAANAADLISGDVATRGVMVMIGLVLAGYANASTKTFASKAPSAHRQGAVRLMGWLTTLAGVAHAGLWTFAPIGFAMIAAPVTVLSAFLVGFGVCGLALRRCRGKSDDDVIATLL